MSARLVLSVIVIQLTAILLLSAVLPGLAEAHMDDITQLPYTLDVRDLQSDFGSGGFGTNVLVNASQTIQLNHAIIIRGSGADTYEMAGLNDFLSTHPVDERMVLNDTERTIGGAPLEDFDLVVVGGPEHNAYTRELIERGFLHYGQTNVSGHGLVIESEKTPTGHTIVVIGSTAGYPVDTSGAAVAIIVGGGLGIFGTYLAAFWSKSFEFVYGYITALAGEVASEKEAEIRKVKAGKPGKADFMGYSWPELVIAASCVLLFSVAFVIADGMTMSADNILVYVTVGGFVVVAHDLGHRLVAYRMNVDAKFKFWGLGSVTMLLTSWLFGLAFAQPGRVIIDKEDHGVNEMAMIMLAGPVVSLALSIVFLLMTPFGGMAGSIGLLGFSMNMVTVVYSMMPFDPMDGKSIYTWNRTWWAVLFIPVTLLFVVATYVVL